MSDRDRAWLEIDLGAVVHNFHQIQRRVGGHTTTMAVVKADAYGHGAVPVARVLENSGVGWFGVATVDEALELRAAGVGGMILIMGLSAPQRAAEVVEARLTPTIMSSADARAFSAAAGDAPLAVHIKADSGMCRMGVRHDDMADFCRQIKDLPDLRYEGIFSHFANAGLDPDFSRFQIRNFQQAVDVAQQILGPFKWHHMCASTALLLYDDAHLNMVRPGDLLYGMMEDVPPEALPPVKPAMTVKARLGLIKPVKPGDRVGYGCIHQVAESQDVGIVTIGYADGYPRQLSNVGQTIIRGKRRPIVGRVSMDTVIVSLGTGHDCQVGDEVVLLGRQGEERITAEELAARAGTITQEIASRMGKRLHRVYQE